MNAADRAQLIQRYKKGHAEVMDALSGVTEAELDRSASQEWTPRMVAHHLGDSEMMSALRLRRLLTEKDPVIHSYDEADFAAKLTYDRPIGPSLEAMRWARESSAQLLDRLTEDDWKKVGTHTESGRCMMDDWLRIYAAHAFDHANQIRRSRGKA